MASVILMVAADVTSRPETDEAQCDQSHYAVLDEVGTHPQCSPVLPFTDHLPHPVHQIQ